MILNIPTILTIIKSLIPLIVILYTYQNGLYRDLSAYVFLLALLTDYFDDLSQEFNQTTSFGAFLDPIADKLLIVITIILLGRDHESLLFLLSSLIIVSREFLVIAIRQRLAEIKSSAIMRVNALSKIKTAFQMISLLFLLHSNIVNSYMNLHIIGLLLLFIAAILTVVSFIYYVRNAWSDIIE